MGPIDDVVFQALTVVLTLLGLVSSVVFWRARGAASGLRVLGVALLPVAAYLTGTLRLLWEIGDAVVSWAVRFAFSPLVWLGIAVAGVSVALFMVASFLRRRGTGTQPTKSGRTGEVGRSDRSAAGSLPASSGRPAASAQETDDLADIEAILKKHGIS